MIHQLRRRWVELVAHMCQANYDCAASCIDASSARRGAGRLCPLYRDVFMLGLAMLAIFLWVSRFIFVADQTNYSVVSAMQSNYSTFLYTPGLWHVVPDYAINNHLTPFISMQNHYNLVYREEEREMFPTLKVSSVGRWRLNPSLLIAALSIYTVLRRGIHPMVSARSRLVDPPVRQEDQTRWNRRVRLFVYLLLKLSKGQNRPRRIIDSYRKFDSDDDIVNR